LREGTGEQESRGDGRRISALPERLGRDEVQSAQLASKVLKRKFASSRLVACERAVFLAR
jgi:hypothetical protein